MSWKWLAAIWQQYKNRSEVKTDEGVAYTDNERFAMSLAALLNMNVSLNDFTVDEIYKIASDRMPEDNFSRGMILKEAFTLYGMSDIYSELASETEGWGLNNLTPINEGRSYAMGNYEIRYITDANGNIQKLEGRKLGSDAKDWLDMTILSPANTESVCDSLYKSAISDYGYRASGGIVGLLNKNAHKEMNQEAVDAAVQNSQTAQSVLTMWRNLGIEKKFVADTSINGGGIKLITINGEN